MATSQKQASYVTRAALNNYFDQIKSAGRPTTDHRMQGPPEDKDKRGH